MAPSPAVAKMLFHKVLLQCTPCSTVKLHTRSPSVKQILGSSKLGVTTVKGWVRAVLRGLLALCLIWIWIQYLYNIVFPKS